MNKILFIVSIVLLPIAVISFFKKETNFISEEKTNIAIKYEDKTINEELEEYIIGVVAGEMPALFEMEALKAQAVAARTYSLNYLDKGILPSTSNQVYITKEEMQEKWQDKYDEYLAKITEAVYSTKGEIITYNNVPIIAYYYSRSNGYTEDSVNVFNEEYDYLKTISSPWDEDNVDIKTISKQDFCEKLQIDCSEISITDINRNESNRVDNLLINNNLYTGIEIRKLLELRSTDFDFEYADDNIIITTKGYGHGVGMSQYGANYMAKVGYNYKEILKYYYQNTEISKM